LGKPLLKYKNFEPTVHESVFVAESAAVIGQVEIGENSSVWFNCVLRGDIDRIVVGKNTNIQDGTVIHVDHKTPCEIGDNVTVGHSAVLHACRISNSARIGMGAIILNKAFIGEGAQVGAGSLVPPGKNIPAGSLFLGVPAKKIRDMGADELDEIKKNSEDYVTLSRSYLKE